MKNSIYLIGSLKNDYIPILANKLRKEGLDIFEDWHRVGPNADDYWQKEEQQRGKSYREALKGYAAQHVFVFDKLHLDRCDTVVLVLPAGKSAHLETGYSVGKGKTVYIYFPDGEPPNDRWDVMYNFANGVIYGEDELIKVLIAD